jgi:uncharacterized membrane protein
MVEPEPDTTVDTARLVAFSDAVFAIVITLLVLDLRPPNVPRGRLLSGLVQEWPGYLAYVTSFLYVGVVWQNHKAAFHRIRLVDRTLHWANLGVLFTTVALPFPTAVLSNAMRLGDRRDVQTAVALYAAVGAVLCLSWLLLDEALYRRPQVLCEPGQAVGFRADRLRAVIGVLLYTVAGFLGVLVAPPIALGIFLVLPAFYGLTSHGRASAPAFARRVHRDG